MVLLCNKVFGWNIVCNSFLESLVFNFILGIEKFFLFISLFVFIINNVFIWFWDSCLIDFIILLIILFDLGRIWWLCLNIWIIFFCFNCLRNLWNFDCNMIVIDIVELIIKFWRVKFNSFRLVKWFRVEVNIKIIKFFIIYNVWCFFMMINIIYIRVRISLISILCSNKDFISILFWNKDFIKFRLLLFNLFFFILVGY